jgi:hypothetical protein
MMKSAGSQGYDKVFFRRFHARAPGFELATPNAPAKRPKTFGVAFALFAKGMTNFFGPF